MNKTETALTMSLIGFAMALCSVNYHVNECERLRKVASDKTEAITLLKEELRICEGR